MPLNTVFRVRMRGTLLSKHMEWGVYLQQVLGTGSSADLAQSWESVVLPLAKAAASSSLNWDEVLVQDTSPTGVESLRRAFAQPAPGTQAGELLPGQDAILISLGTGQKGRRKHGRFFFPGVLEANQNAGVLSGAQLTAAQALANGLLNAYGPSGSNTAYRLVIYSPPSPPYKPKPAPPQHTDTIITPVTTTATSIRIKSQRRRAF